MTPPTLNGFPFAAPTFQGQPLTLPPLQIPSHTNPLVLQPSLRSVAVVDLYSTHLRAAFAPLDNSVCSSPTGLEAGLREKLAAQALANRADRKTENNTLAPRVSLVTPPNPSSEAIPYAGIVLSQKRVFVQEGIQPHQPVPAAAQQPTRRKRKELDWKDGTPAVYRSALKAEAETKVKPEPLPATPAVGPTLPKREIKAEPDIKSEGAEQQLPELMPVQTAVRKSSRRKKEPKVGLVFPETVTPDNYRATIAARRTSGNSEFYQFSEDSLASSKSISEAAEHMGQKRYQKAIAAIYQALFFLQGKQGFVFLLLSKLQAMRTNTDPRITSSLPEEDLDVLILRGIYKIKHGKYESAKIDFQQVLTRRPYEQLAQILLNHTNAIIDYPPDLNWTPAKKAPKQESSGTPPS